MWLLKVLVIGLALFGLVNLAHGLICRWIVHRETKLRQRSVRLARRSPKLEGRRVFPTALAIPLLALIGALGAVALAVPLQASLDARTPPIRIVQNRGPDMSLTATWYGLSYAGRPTASGEPFNPDALTVAHRTLPLDSRVEILARDGFWIQARVNDRGPWCIHGPSCKEPCRRADLDLSEELAWQVGIHEAGRARVIVRRLL